MADGESRDVLREQLREVEERQAALRRAAADLRRQIGESGGLGDAAEAAEILREAEEQEALAASLEARRRDLLSKLEE
ncbi:MAG TPA: hypothetical protein VIL34_10550 [Actinopolymorphaceae bacterium]|jgi:UDP:flavonoid glycosyltransferase YjiC (YdhE family)